MSFDRRGMSVGNEVKRGAVSVPVIAIGASAGGVEAIREFFTHVPPQLGCAFVVIQHLSPDFKSVMAELLKQNTAMPVVTAEHNMPLVANTIYLIPPKYNMHLYGEYLHLIQQDRAVPVHLPIDIFFVSLAKHYPGHSVGIIMSGTGNDGTQGVRALADAGRLVLAQEPSEAKFDSMPKSAIDTSCVDYVLSLQAMPALLSSYVSAPSQFMARHMEHALTDATKVYKQVLDILSQQYHIDFSLYKPKTIARRILRRMQLISVTRADQFIQRVEKDALLREQLLEDILINVTSFFRDKEAFDYLRDEVIPHLLDKLSKEKPICRVWIAVCSSGQEVYSIAILFAEAVKRVTFPVDIKIFATDINKKLLEYASHGVYPQAEVEILPPKYVKNYFLPHDDGYQVSRKLRNLVVFAPHDLMTDPPFTKMNLVSCRNFLIYVDPKIQQKILGALRFSLQPGGYLFLGPSESMGDVAPDFSLVKPYWKIFKKTFNDSAQLSLDPSYVQTNSIQIPPKRASARAYQVGNSSTYENKALLTLRAYNQLLKKFIKTGLLLNNDRKLLHVFGDSMDFIHLSAGPLETDVINLLVKPLQAPLGTALNKVSKEKIAVEYTDIALRNEQNDLMNVIVSPLLDVNNQIEYHLVELIRQQSANVLSLGPEAKVADKKIYSHEIIEELQNELHLSHESLQVTVEELEATNEEMQSANEELLAANEELHSVNEELYTVNAEYQQKIDELMQLNNDMNNLMRSSNIGTIFIDKELKIRRYTPAVAKIFHLAIHDIGRPISHFSHSLQYDSLVSDIQNVLTMQRIYDIQVSTIHQRIFLLRVSPYLTERGACDGVVLTFIDFAELNKVTNQFATTEKIQEINLAQVEYSASLYQSALLFKAHEKAYQAIFDSVTDAWWDWNLENNTIYLSAGFKSLMGYAEDELSGDVNEWKNMMDDADRLNLETALQRHLEANVPYHLTLRYCHKTGGTVWVLCRGQAIKDSDGQYRRMVGTHTDITPLKLAENRLAKVASQDPLTRLLNRDALLDILAQRISFGKRSEKLFAVMFIDLDDFKLINDSYGHAIGDQVLVEVAQRLTVSIRCEDTLARVGGDEFIVIAEQLDSPHRASQIANRILSHIAEPFQCGQQHVDLGVSVGIAIFPAGGETAAELIHHADVALYRAKAMGKNQYGFYTERFDKESKRYKNIQSRFIHACEARQCQIRFAPILNMTTETLYAVEAVVQWQDPQLGLVSQNELIAAASQHDFSEMLMRWMVGEIQRHYVELKKALAGIAYKLFIPLFDFPAMQQQLFTLLDERLIKNGMQARDIVVTLTESTYVKMLQSKRDLIPQLQTLGIGGALEDYGAAGASLQRLTETIFTHIKLAVELLDGLDGTPSQRAMLQGIIAICHARDMPVIAKQVTTSEQMETLITLGCHFKQASHDDEVFADLQTADALLV